MDELLETRKGSINLNAGPSPLPVDCLLETTKSIISFDNGMGIAEISHRSAAFEAVIDQATADIKTLYEIPDNYDVLWMQGGGSTQFAATALNLMAWYKTKTGSTDDILADYCITGGWSLKASQEAGKLGVKIHAIVDSRLSVPEESPLQPPGKFGSIPGLDAWDLHNHFHNYHFSTDQPIKTQKPAYVYYCDNETVDGVEFAPGQFPIDHIDPDVPIVCDMSSNFLSRPVDVSRYGIIYAGAQKNLGPAGVSLVIIRKDLLVDTDSFRIPTMLSYKIMAKNKSLYNTPPTLVIYMCGLVLKKLLTQPPLPLESGESPLGPIGRYNSKKSALLYSIIDSSDGFYTGTAAKNCRSRMNVTFRIKGGDEEVEKRFIEEAKALNIYGVKGHRSAGGVRASLYNAVTLEQVQVLANLMTAFLAKNK